MLYPEARSYLAQGESCKRVKRASSVIDIKRARNWRYLLMNLTSRAILAPNFLLISGGEMNSDLDYTKCVFNFQSVGGTRMNTDRGTSRVA